MRSKWLWVTLAVAVASTVPASYRTAILASDASGLLIIASMADDEFTMDPYSKDGIFVSPDRAAWILLNFEYPYEHCSRVTQAIEQCDHSLIAAIGTFLDRPDAEVRTRLYKLLDHFITKGLSVDARDKSGIPVVHPAVLFNNPRYLEILIAAGADLSATSITKFGSIDALTFARLLEEKNPEYGGVRTILQNHERTQ